MAQAQDQHRMKISTDHLVKVYRHKPVVNGISLEVEQGEVVGLLGPNGAGKTTTFYMVVGLVKPNSGRVRLDDQDITRLPMYRRARAGISYLPQEPSVFRNLTVEENLHLVLEMMPLNKKDRRERADGLLEHLHITHLRHRLGRVLSGGERRRVEIARALATRPKFILLDEPFTGVDPIAIEDIGTIIHSLAKSEDRIGILITDHNVNAMLSITERAYIVADGQLRTSGRSDQLAYDPEARASYFGKNFMTARQAAEEELRHAAGDWNDDDLNNPKKPQEQGKNEKGKDNPNNPGAPIDKGKDTPSDPDEMESLESQQRNPPAKGEHDAAD
jgi:lipopolysaccharide export system ATP-binding protein